MQSSLQKIAPKKTRHHKQSTKHFINILKHNTLLQGLFLRVVANTSNGYIQREWAVNLGDQGNISMGIHPYTYHMHVKWEAPNAEVVVSNISQSTQRKQLQ